MLDITIICIYFLIIIAVSMRKSSRNVKDMNDFAVARKSFPISILIFTFLATSFGAGSTVGDTSKVYQDGLVFLFGISGFFIFCIMMILFLAKYFDHRFKDMISSGDIIKYFYGEKAEFVTGILGLIISTFVVAGQIKAIAVFVSHYSGFNHYYVTIIAGLMVAFYTAIGGIRAVTITDVIQWIVLAIVFPYIVFVVGSKVGGISQIFVNVPSEQLSILSHPKFYEYLALFIAGCMPFLWMYPPLIQRYLMANNYDGIRSMYIAELTVRPLVMALVMILAFSCFTLLPDTEASDLVPNLLNEVLGDGFRGLVIAMVLAAGMSSSDSHLNSSAVLVTKHVIAKFFDMHKPKIQIIVLRTTTVLLAVLAMLMAFSDTEIVDGIIYGFCLWGVGFSIPMFFGLLRFPTTPYVYWSSLIVGTISFTYSTYIAKLPGLIPPLIAIFSSLIISSLFVLKKHYSNNYSTFPTN